MRGTRDADLASLLADFGVTFTLRPRRGVRDEGGSTALPEPPPVSLGAQLSRSTPQLVTVVLAWCCDPGLEKRASTPKLSVRPLKSEAG